MSVSMKLLPDCHSYSTFVTGLYRDVSVAVHTPLFLVTEFQRNNWPCPRCVVWIIIYNRRTKTLKCVLVIVHPGKHIRLLFFNILLVCFSVWFLGMDVKHGRRDRRNSFTSCWNKLQVSFSNDACCCLRKTVKQLQVSPLQGNTRVENVCSSVLWDCLDQRVWIGGGGEYL
jgi:hypothetical protein